MNSMHQGGQQDMNSSSMQGGNYIEQLHAGQAPLNVTENLQNRRELENKQRLMIANSEIEELKDGLNYAEYMLAKTMQEKESFED